jgi:hypothetical protein
MKKTPMVTHKKKNHVVTLRKKNQLGAKLSKSATSSTPSIIVVLMGQNRTETMDSVITFNRNTTIVM